ncbi:hypothetical protein [Streptomyces sp. NBC_00057]|uniref:hypothetical protein n=1 Tax=Streptomyces sp. NBC_00057 TaxID=2975634 RepID=UPI003252BB7E
MEPDVDRSEFGQCLYRPVKCPVCGADGDVRASLGNQPKHSYRKKKRGRLRRNRGEFPDYFDCYTCGLELDNRYELEVLGMAEPSQNGWFAD